MLDSDKKTASCLCGSVKIEAAEVNPKFTVCHCDTCIPVIIQNAGFDVF